MLKTWMARGGIAGHVHSVAYCCWCMMDQPWQCQRHLRWASGNLSCLQLKLAELNEQRGNLREATRWRNQVARP